MSNKDKKSLPSEIKAAINENTGIIYDNRTTQKTRESAEKDNARIFKKYGNLAHKHYNSIIGKIKEGAAENKKLDAAANKLNSGEEPSKKSNKKDKIAVMIAVGKPKMAYGGSVKGKKHFYSNGGSVKDNAGLIALGKQSPSTYKKITGREFKNEYKGP